MCTMVYTLVKSVQYCTYFFSLQYEIYINSKYKLKGMVKYRTLTPIFKKKKKKIHFYSDFWYFNFKSYISISLLFEWNFS